MATDAATYSWRGNKKKATILGTLCLIASIYIACVATLMPSEITAPRAIMAVVIAALFLCAALALQMYQVVSINPNERCVSRLMTFFGLSLWRKEWPLSDFSAVHSYRLNTGTPQSPIDLVHVGLMRPNGSTLAVRYFLARRDSPCPAAEEFADNLRRAIGAFPIAEPRDAAASP